MRKWFDKNLSKIGYSIFLTHNAIAALMVYLLSLHYVNYIKMPYIVGDFIIYDSMLQRQVELVPMPMAYFSIIPEVILTWNWLFLIYSIFVWGYLIWLIYNYGWSIYKFGFWKDED